MMRVFLAFGANDLKSVRRDSLLFSVLITPALLVLALRLAVPPLTIFFQTRYGFDLQRYYPLVACFFLLLNIPLLLGIITGFLMLDERDDDTLTALRVTPTALGGVIGYRLLTGFLLSTVAIMLTIPLSGLVVLQSAWQLLPATMVAALFAPVATLALVAFARNKLEGFALMKGAGLLLMGPIASLFVSGWAQYLFVILPTYWPLQALVAALADKPSALYISGGLLYNVVLMVLLYTQYRRQFAYGK
ncbi:ABC transporter permease subunit [Candidatus Gracilibacteria bacterium]|nr:ABC transporter permease subunit [Candidatus Gracilibacteria bacterium]